MNIWQWIGSLNSDEREMIIFFGSIALVMIAWIVSRAVQRIHRARLEDSLKRELVERGMSAEDIVGIVQASSTAVPRGCRVNAKRV
jgi:hypothetical protein